MSRIHRLSRHLDMRCPACKRKLIPGEPKRYETLVDHVEDPNGERGERPFRETWVCSCGLGTFGYWGYEGGFYVTGGYSALHKCYKRNPTFGYSAVFSFDWLIEIDHKIMWFKYGIRQRIKKLKGEK